ncbi:ABC transporter permease [Raoultibacter phocaeensis]|uniref:ABC transporter permease n=1 Tax=Raoultibacter phocaeensis TaxID=2479841 RepID=UPI00111946F6|nr:ABC transporter permease [Raoultibacter phocaeensis]
MNAALRKIGALSVKDAKDVFRNPAIAVCALMPIGFMLLYRYVMLANIASQEHAIVDSFLLGTAPCFTVGMVSAMTIIYALSEEKEKHTLRTLMLANVSGSQVMAAKVLVSLVVIALVDLVCFLVIGLDVSLVVPYLAIAIVGSASTVLFSLVLGLVSRDMVSSGVYALPVLVIALLPMFGMFSDGFRMVASYSPCGGMYDLLGLLYEGRLFTPDAIMPLVSMFAWIVICAVAFVLAFKKLGKDN